MTYSVIGETVCFLHFTLHAVMCPLDLIRLLHGVTNSAFLEGEVEQLQRSKAYRINALKAYEDGCIPLTPPSVISFFPNLSLERDLFLDLIIHVH